MNKARLDRLKKQVDALEFAGGNPQSDAELTELLAILQDHANVCEYFEKFARGENVEFPSLTPYTSPNRPPTSWGLTILEEQDAVFTRLAKEKSMAAQLAREQFLAAQEARTNTAGELADSHAAGADS